MAPLTSLLRPHWPPRCGLNTLLHSLHSLCTCCSLCLDQSLLRSPQGSPLTSFSEVHLAPHFKLYPPSSNWSQVPSWAVSPEGGGSCSPAWGNRHLAEQAHLPEGPDLPAVLPSLHAAGHRSRRVGCAVAACGGAGSAAAAPGTATFPGSSPYELLKLIYDGSAQACGFRA